MKDDDKIIEHRIDMIIKQFSGKVDIEDGEMIPEVAIKGQSGYLYCFSPIKNRLIRIHRGTKAYVLKDANEKGITLIYTFSGRILEIEDKELIFTGFD